MGLKIAPNLYRQGLYEGVNWIGMGWGEVQCWGSQANNDCQLISYAED